MAFGISERTRSESDLDERMNVLVKSARAMAFTAPAAARLWIIMKPNQARIAAFDGPRENCTSMRAAESNWHMNVALCARGPELRNVS
jgi:hypothetical protein